MHTTTHTTTHTTMHTTADAARITALVALLNGREQAKTERTPEDNPLANHDMKALAHGLRKGADNIPAVNMAAKAPDSSAAFALEAGRFATATEGRTDKSAKRMAQAKARARRKVEFDQIASARFTPDPERMARAWLVVVHLVPIIGEIAKSKQRWANRLLGSNADDIPQMALEATALVLAKQQKWDLDLLRTAAEQLGQSRRRIPGDQTVVESDPEEVKQVRKARKWLMGMVNNRVMGALVDSYTSVNNLRWDNLDQIATVMASIGGVGEDPMTSRFKADRAPAFLGSRFQRPGGIDADALAMAITGAITEHGLDPLTEYLLDDEHRRVDGSVKWTQCAQDIFLLTPGGHGQWLWEAVCDVTENHDRRAQRRGEKAMLHVRNLFSWLPGLIVSVIDAFDPHMIGWSAKSHLPVYVTHEAPVQTVETININLGSGVIPSPNPNFPDTVGQPVGDEAIEQVQMLWLHRKEHARRVIKGQAILASDFELFYLGDKHPLGEERFPLQPALKFASSEEAATALIEHLALLTTGNQFVKEIN